MMAAITYDFRRQLVGRSLVTIPPVEGDSPAARLSRRTGEGSAQMSLLVYHDGTVVVGHLSRNLPRVQVYHMISGLHKSADGEDGATDGEAESDGGLLRPASLTSQSR